MWRIGLSEDREGERVHVERRAAEPCQPAVDLPIDLRTQVLVLEVKVLVAVDPRREEGRIWIQARRVVMFVPSIEDEQQVRDLGAHACLADAAPLPDMVGQGAGVVVHHVAQGALCAHFCQHSTNVMHLDCMSPTCWVLGQVLRQVAHLRLPLLLLGDGREQPRRLKDLAAAAAIGRRRGLLRGMLGGPILFLRCFH